MNYFKLNPLDDRGLFGLFIALLTLLFVFLLLPQPTFADGLWETTCINCTDNYGRFSKRNLDLNSAGEPILVVGGEHVYTLSRDVTGTWGSEKIEYDAAGVVQVAIEAMSLDANNVPTVAYRDSVNDALHLMKLENGSLVSQSLPAELASGKNPVLHFSAETLHLTLFDPATNSLKYARRVNDTWTVQALSGGSEAAEFFDMTLSNDGSPAIAWGEGNLVYQARHDGVEWVIDSAEIDPVLEVVDTAIHIDSTNTAHIAVNAYEVVYYFNWPAQDSPTSEIIHEADIFFPAGIHIGQVGNAVQVGIPYFSSDFFPYPETAFTGMKILEKNLGAWHMQAESAVEGRTSSREVNAIFWNDGNQSTILYGTDAGIHIVPEGVSAENAVTLFETHQAGDSLSLHTDQTGTLHAGYRNRAHFDLRHAQNSARDGWTISSVLSSARFMSDSEDEVTLSVNNAGQVLGTAFRYRRFQPTLSMAYNMDGQWVEPAYSSEVFGDLRAKGHLDQNGSSHFVGLNFDSLGYYYTECSPLICSAPIVTPIPTSDFNAQFELQPQSDGTPHLIYEMDNALGHAILENGGWATETLIVADAHLLGAFMSNSLHVLYRNSMGSLELAVWKTGTWRITPLQKSVNATYGDVFVASTGITHISYFDEDSQTLYYMTNRHNDWYRFEVASSIGTDVENALVATADGMVSIAWQHEGRQDVMISETDAFVNGIIPTAVTVSQVESHTPFTAHFVAIVSLLVVTVGCCRKGSLR